MTDVVATDDDRQNTDDNDDTIPTKNNNMGDDDPQRKQQEMERLLLEQNEEIDFIGSTAEVMNVDNKNDKNPTLITTVTTDVDNKSNNNSINLAQRNDDAVEPEDSDTNDNNGVIPVDAGGVAVNDNDQQQRMEQEMVAALVQQQQEQEELQRQQREGADDELLQLQAEGMVGDDDGNNHLNHRMNPPPPKNYRRLYNVLSYRRVSLWALIGLLYYAFRTRKQYYLAMVYLSSSKWAYVILGNAVIAFAVTIFDVSIALFLQGLRIQEAEGLNDFFRWNVTETCLALTMFRNELSVTTAIDFVALITVKCLHHVTSLREQHLRMTQEAIVEGVNGYPKIRTNHLRLLVFLIVLQLCDFMALQYTVSHIITNTISVKVLFAFEAAIMLVSAWSHILLWYLHCLDSLLLYGHERRTEEQANGITSHSVFSNICYKSFHRWKEYKPMLQFAVQLQSQAIQFLFYTTFFAIVLTFYGMPINLFREVYMSFIAFKERLIAFMKYRRLMASMNRFDDIENDAVLDEAGRTCIICRDEMSLRDCKRLPGCNHIFHKSCLREWLVQQQTCPTCRSDITANEIQERTRRAAAAAAEQRGDVAAADGSAGANVAAGAATDVPVDVVDNNNIARDDIDNNNGAVVVTADQQQRPGTTGDASEMNRTIAATVAADTQSTYSVPSNHDNGITPPTTMMMDRLSVESDHDSTLTTQQMGGSLHQQQQQANDRNRSMIRNIYDISSIRQSLRFLEEVQKQQQRNIFDLSSRRTTDAATTNTTASHTNDTKFPAIYKVIHTDGASVYTDCFCRLTTESTTGGDGVMPSSPLRKIPYGTYVLGQGIAKSSVSMSPVRTHHIKIPDGWVDESLLSREGTVIARKKQRREVKND